MIHLLHISDLHLVTDPQWNNMKNAILYSVQEKLCHIPLGQKLLVITGDFHNFVEKEYTQAEQFLQQLVEAMNIDAKQDVFVIPGNHDISPSGSSNSDVAFTISAIKNNPAMLKDGMDKLLTRFDKYIQFVQSGNIYPADSNKLPACAHVRTWRNKLNILHLNTVLIADGSMKNNQMADTLTATSDEIRRQLRFAGLPCIAIGHNSFFDLHPEQQKQLSALFFQEYISAYLCGDRHQKNSVRENNHIVLNHKLSAVTIPNIVSYRSSTDENDTYSDFGMIWQDWDEKTGHVDLSFMKWDPEDQAELQPDGNDCYTFRKRTSSTNAAGSSKNAAVSNDSSCWLTNKIILEKGSLPVKKSQMQRFLHGGRCEWNLAFFNRIVLRDIVDDLYGFAEDGGIYVLVGPGGEGKTTILKQLCAKLILNDIPVLYYGGKGTLKIPENVSDQAVFILDNPPENKNFKNFLDTIIENGQTLILSSRQNEWNLLKMYLDIPSRDIIEVPLNKLTVKESWDFAECITANLKCKKSKAEIQELFLNNSYGFLYAAMLMVVNNKNSLEEIAAEIVANLYKRSQKAALLLAHIVFSEWYEVKFHKSQLRQTCDILGILPKEAMYALSREISLNGNIYQTRHEVISKLFYKELFSNSGQLSPNQINSVLENLLMHQLNRYQAAYGNIKINIFNCILRLSGGLAQTTLETQTYLIDRMLDELTSQPSKNFYMLPSYIKDEEVQLLFYKKCFDREHIFSAFIINWCNLLQKKGSLGAAEEPYSAIWILKTACIDYNASKDTWLTWAMLQKQIETQTNSFGDYNTEYSARWIFHESCIERSTSSDNWLAWAQFEAQSEMRANCIKDYNMEYSARWIFREACLNRHTNSSVWTTWAQFEAQVEAQLNKAKDYNTEYSARWIFREACLNHSADSDTWLAWAQLEAQSEIQANCIKDNDSAYSARWIFCEACLNHHASSSNWLAWAQFEAQVETQANCIKNYDTMYSARWIFRNACLDQDVDSSVWLAWARFEERQNNIGNCETTYTTSWIFSKSIQKFPTQAELYRASAITELSLHSAKKARELLQQAAQLNDYYIGDLAILEFFYSEDTYSVNRLMDQADEMKEFHLHTLQLLYHCSLLLQQTERADRYYRKLLAYPNFNPDYAHVDSFIQLCREAVAFEQNPEQVI